MIEVYTDLALANKVILTSTGAGTHTVKDKLFSPTDYYSYTAEVVTGPNETAFIAAITAKAGNTTAQS